MTSWIKKQARKYEQFVWAEPTTRRQCLEFAKDAYMMRNIMMQDQRLAQLKDLIMGIFLYYYFLARRLRYKPCDAAAYAMSWVKWWKPNEIGKSGNSPSLPYIGIDNRYKYTLEGWKYANT